MASLKPTVNRGIDGVEAEVEDEPTWVADILDKGLWSVVSDRAEQQFIHIEVGQFDPTAGPFRMAFVLKGVREDAIPDIRVFASDREGGFNREPLSHRMAWRLRMPDPAGGQRMVLVVVASMLIWNRQQKNCWLLQRRIPCAQC